MDQSGGVQESPRFARSLPVGVLGGALMGACLLVSISALPVAGQDAEPGVTFAEDVAPILQESCQVCHRTGGVAPMSFLTYEEVRPWAPLIREKVEDRIMPPWHLSTTLGIQEYTNDRSLSDEEIATIVAWEEAGAPFGDPADLPEPIEWPDGGEWQLELEAGFGEPDLVVASEPYTIAPNGQDQWWGSTVETDLEEGRWIRAIEVRPDPDVSGNHEVAHHAVLYLESPDTQLSYGGLMTEWAAGKVGEVMPENTGRFMPAGSGIRWDVHYFPQGEEVRDSRVEVALWFYPEGEEPELRSEMRMFRADPMEEARGAHLDIPPHSKRMVQGAHALSNPTRIESFSAHMHLRGVAMSLEAVYPDGRREVLSVTDRFDQAWQIQYKFADHVMPLLPAGTVLLVTSWHDNTVDNPHNPDPDQWVGFGRRTVDEMAHAWVSLNTLTAEQFEELVREREATLSAQQ